MGMTFCNMNLYNPEKKSYDLEEGLEAVRITEDWDTIIESDDERDFDRISKLAKDLSKSLDTNAVVTIYFDDDIFGLDVFSGGAMKAFYHITYEGTESKNVPHLTNVLDLTSSDSKAFKYLLRQDMYAGDAVSKLSAISGLPFFVDKFIFEHDKKAMIPDKNQVLEEVNAQREKELATTRQKAGSTLLSEMPGMIVYPALGSNDSQDGVVRVVQPSSNWNKADYDHIHCFQIAGDETAALKEIHDYRYPFEEWAPGEDNRLLGRLPDCVLLLNDRECVVREFDKEEEMQAIKEIERIPETALLTNKYEYGVIGAVAPLDLPINPGNLEKLADADVRSNFFLVNNTWARKDNGFIVRMASYHDYKNREHYVVVDIFDEEEKFLRTEMIKIDNDFKFYQLNSDYIYIPEKDQIVFGEYVIDLKEKTLTESVTLPASMSYITRRRSASGQEILVAQSGKNIFVFDMNYQPLGSASVKGATVLRMFDNQDNMYVVTASNILGYGYKSEYKVGDTVSLYKIALLGE